MTITDLVKISGSAVSLWVRSVIVAICGWCMLLPAQQRAIGLHAIATKLSCYTLWYTIKPAAIWPLSFDFQFSPSKVCMCLESLWFNLYVLGFLNKRSYFLLPLMTEATVGCSTGPAAACENCSVKMLHKLKLNSALQAWVSLSSVIASISPP